MYIITSELGDYSWLSEQYEGCSNMNASGFITFFTYMLQQNGKRFYKGLYVTFQVVTYLKKKYGILIEL